MYRLDRPLILASQSPRRSDLLRRFGFPFRVLSASVSERTAPRLSPARKVVLLARRKALAAAPKVSGRGLILGFDTIVFFKGRVLEKPRTRAEAFRMLRALSGRVHTVYTGCAALRLPENRLTATYEKTRVRFRPLRDAEIKNYISSGEPFDKAGAYGIQGLGGTFVRSVNGCFFNVVGLPVRPLMEAIEPLIV